MTTIILKPHKEESVLRFHPWVFSGAIARIVLDASHAASAPEEGEWVRVESAAHEVLGIGHWQVGSIAVRLITFGTDKIPDGFWQERIQAAYTMRERLGLIRKDNTIYRLVHGEGDMLPGLVIDVYGRTAVMQAHSVGMHRCRQEIADAVVQAVPEVEAVYYKSDDTLPHKADIREPKTGYSNDWKIFFQWLEIFGPVFQRLEKISGGFPTIGKIIPPPECASATARNADLLPR